jgi:replicative DNA helicase
MARIAPEDANLLPHNVEAEEAVIGSLLIDPDAVFPMREVGLTPGEFYVERLGAVYAAMMGLADQMLPIDAVTVCGALESRQNGHGSALDAIGGPAELARLMAATPTSIHARHYAQMVHDAARRRRLISVAGDIAALADGYEGSMDALYDQVSGALFGAMERPEAESHLYGTDEGLASYEALLQDLAERARDPRRFPVRTWLPSADAILDELTAGDIHAVTAITSVGKTIYMEQVAEANAQRGHHVAYYHLELTHTRMLHRRMARHSGIAMPRLRQGYSGPEVMRAQESIRTWHQNLVYVHCPGWTAERIVADITRLHARGECDLAVVDYLNKIAYSDDGHKNWNEASFVGAKVEALKTCIERLEIPMVLGAQLNREYKGRQRPQFDDLKGSSDIEQKVNQIVVLHRPYERPAGDRFDETEELWAYVDKNSDHATGKAVLWHRLGRFRLECREDRASESEPIPF